MSKRSKHFINYTKNILHIPSLYAILDIRKAPTPKWMPQDVFVLTDVAYPVCRQDRHFYFFFLILTIKVRNAAIELLRDISKPNTPRNIIMIS